MLALPAMWHRALLALLLVAAAERRAEGQAWNDPRTRALVERATTRRLSQLADSTLVDTRATAHGYLTFLAQLGEGFLLPPKVVRADELALEVYWRAPNLSKQWIVGRRDTLVLPTDIQYHRDHLGIIQNNFPDIIRLGDGDEVRDVPHPLSPSGLATYEFQIADSLRFELPGRGALDVYEVKVRPRDDRDAAAVGAVYLARDDAQVVRMAFSFTRAALKDKLLEDVSIILENSLIEGRYWLPRRQEIEIRRSGSWMDFPVKGIIRGRWEIRDYTVNAGGTEALAPGPEITLAPPARRAAFRFPATRIVDSLPSDIALATGEEVRQVQEEARRLVRAQALARTRQTLPSARGISDLLQVNRVEGIAVGGGARRQLGHGLDLGVRARFGTADRAVKGVVTLGWQRADGLAIQLAVGRDFRDAGDEAEVSRVRNSIAAQEWGADLTQPYRATGATLTVSGRAMERWRWAIEGAIDDHESLDVHASPARGAYRPTLEVLEGSGSRLGVRVERPGAPMGSFADLRIRGEARLARRERSDGLVRSSARLWASVEATRSTPLADVRLRVAGGGVFAADSAPAQELLYAGGPVTAPGYGYHQFRATGLGQARLELRRIGPFVPIPLGRWGRIPATATWAPYAGMVTVHAADSWTGYPLVGLGIEPFLQMVRVDIARGLRDGRWRFAVDLSRDFWPIL
ncbi:MAG: hypothetical protein IPK85_14395 [Gemmatimonadetes bacterium]|nr:hypothetical protein [Gemmatimonadota bacterium]